MTKRISITNDDMNDQYDVEVLVMDRGVDGAPDTVFETVPVALGGVEQRYIHSGRYLIVREAVKAVVDVPDVVVAPE